MRVALITEQLRRRVPGGIGTYVRGLLRGTPTLPDRGVWVEPRQWRAPVPLVTRAWERGLLGGREDIDVVHAPSLAFPPSRSPLVVTIHGLEWRDPSHLVPDRARRWHEAQLARAVERGALLLASSDALALQLRSEGIHRVATLEGGLYGADHLPPPDDTAAAELLGSLSVEGDFLLSVGTLEPRKNLPRLGEAYARARPMLAAPIPLVVVGPTGWGPGLAPTEGLVLAGAVPDAALSALYRRTRALVYVPLHEGYGLPVVEAMHAAAPVVASPVPSAGAAALEVDPTDVAAIADAIVRVCDDEQERVRLVAAGASHTAELTWDRAAERHADLWCQVAKGTR
jgi:glycosyltransferase involved in cell wall biosynthesis